MFGSARPHGTGCTCGAAKQLEEERLRRSEQCRLAADRGRHLALREADMDGRARALEAGWREVALGEDGLAQRRCSAEGQDSTLEARQREAEELAATVAREEESWRRDSAGLAALEREVADGEGALAREELALIEERNRHEDELKHIVREMAALQHQAQARAGARQEHRCRLAEVEREREALSCDELILDEICAQVEPTSRRLDEREASVDAFDRDLCAREADCDEQEAGMLPQYRSSTEALRVAEERLHELAAREEESERQRRELQRRQRDLGSSETRLSGLEGAAARLQRRGALGDAAPAGASLGGGGAACSGAQCLEEVQAQLERLWREDATWAERARLQQSEVQRLEAQAAQLEATISSRSWPEGAAHGYAVASHSPPASFVTSGHVVTGGHAAAGGQAAIGGHASIGGRASGYVGGGGGPDRLAMKLAPASALGVRAAPARGVSALR